LHQELGLMVVMVTHDLDTILELSTRIAVVADRHIVAEGSAAFVMAQPHPFIKEFFLGERGLRASALLQPDLSGAKETPKILFNDTAHSKE